MADLDGDLKPAREWWSALKPEVPNTVRGLWFGIFDAASKGDVARTLYVAGTPKFVLDDETAEWATEYVWEPAGRYVVLPVLAALPDQPYEAILSHTAEVVRQLDEWSGLGVAVGFDDGDFLVVSDGR